MAWRSYIAPADDPNGNAGKLIWTDDQGHFQVGGTSPEGGASPTPSVSVPPTNTSATGGVDAAALQWALNAQIAAQAAKTNADRLNLLDIPAAQKAQAIADADLKLRQAQDARAALSDAQKLQLDQQSAALNTAKTFGYGQTLGPGTGDRILSAADQLRQNPDYQALQQRVANGDQAALAQKKQMEMATIAQATGLPIDRATALYTQLNDRRIALAGQMPTGADIDRLLAQDPSYQTPTLENQQGQTDTALKYLQLRASMSGRPEDAFTYAATLRDTPQSIRDIINSAAGRANLPGLGFPGSSPAAGAQPAAGGGAAPAAASGNSVSASASPTPPGGQAGGASSAVPTGGAAPSGASGGTTPGTGAPSGQMTNTLDPNAPQRTMTASEAANTAQGSGQPPAPTIGGMDAALTAVGAAAGPPVPKSVAGGQSAPGGGGGGSVPGTQTAQTRTTTGAPAGTIQPQAPLNAGQIAPQDYQRANPYLQKMVWAGFGATGQDPDAAKATYLKSLPRYRQSQTGRIAA